MTSIIVCFFSPCDYTLPKENFQKCLTGLQSVDAEVIVVQAVLSGQSPQPVPENFKSLVFSVDTAWFRKENLWNVGARASSGDKLIFLDSDVVYEDDDWVSKCNDALDKYHVIQPFSVAVWRDPNLNELQRKTSAAQTIRDGNDYFGGAHHPGFGWGMTRQAFNATGGFHEDCITGEGDVAFALSFIDDERIKRISRWLRSSTRFFGSRKYKAYRRHNYSLGLRVGIPEDVSVFHLWHGNISDRGYHDRYKRVPPGVSGEYDLILRPDGIKELARKQDIDNMNEYFHGRKEDGRHPGYILCGMGKSGSNSTAQAFRDLGFQPLHMGDAGYHNDFRVRNLLHRNHVENKPMLDGIKGYDMLADWPCPLYFSEIADQYPDTKFILTYRDPMAAALSWGRMTHVQGLRGTDAWPKHRGYKSFLDETIRHIDRVFDYFSDKIDRLLVLDMADPDITKWRLLADFLDVKPPLDPNKPFPRVFDHRQWELDEKQRMRNG